MRLCIIARADLTGLGVQSRNWVRLLNPQKLVVINSKFFNNNEQHLEWYGGRGGYIIEGFIKSHEINAILKDIDVLLTFEIPYNYELISAAKSRGIKTIIQNNWEFTDYLNNSYLPLPDMLVNHSYWHLEDQKKLWPEITEYCPTPLFVEDYDEVMLHNLERVADKLRFLHIAGRKTHEDRNGTKDLIEAMKLIPHSYDFELVIKAQNADVPEFNDSRIIIDRSEPVDEKELYRDFDVVVMPRRYGGACLPMNESLAAGLPVLMPDIEPNNTVLMREWLVKAQHQGSFIARTRVDLYSVEHQALADKIIEFVNFSRSHIVSSKVRAREIALREYSDSVVLEKWHLLMSKLRV